MNYEQFQKFYREKGYLPNDVGRRKNSLNEKQLQTRFKKYQKQQDHRRKKLSESLKKERKRSYEVKVDGRWEVVKNQMDLNNCLLIQRLKEDPGGKEVLDVLMKLGGGFLKTIDPAHVISRSQAPHLKYESKNVVPLNRYSHSMLDTMRDPIYGNPLTKDKRDEWWEFIVGETQWAELQEMKRRG